MKSLGVIVGLLVCSLTGFSQAEKRDNYWFDFGAGGFETLRNLSGVSVILSYTQRHDSIYYTFRFIGNSEFGDVLAAPVPNEEYYSYGFLFGKGFSAKYAQIHFTVGVGITEGIRRGALIKSVPGFFGYTDYYERVEFRTPAIPLEIDILLKPLRWGGVGVTFFGDLNFVRSYCGVAFKVSLGRLR